MIRGLRSELSKNSHAKSKFIIAFFRLASKTLNWPPLLWPLAKAIQVGYRIIVDWVMGVDIPIKTKIGEGLIIYHGIALVINENAIIGKNCILRHSTTIGNKIIEGTETLSPIIGDNVEIGAGVCIIGPVNIGDNCVIGVNSVVTKSLPPNSIAFGSPAKVIRSLDNVQKI
ncbi:Serine acetyltransferase [compost metagenome]